MGLGCIINTFSLKFLAGLFEFLFIVLFQFLLKPATINVDKPCIFSLNFEKSEKNIFLSCFDDQTFLL